MLNAYSRIDRVIQDIVNRRSHIEGKIDDLEILQNILDNDCTILHMVTDNKDDAFRLFQAILDMNAFTDELNHRALWHHPGKHSSNLRYLIRH